MVRLLLKTIQRILAVGGQVVSEGPSMGRTPAFEGPLVSRVGCGCSGCRRCQVELAVVRGGSHNFGVEVGGAAPEVVGQSLVDLSLHARQGLDEILLQ